jgi:hypothetical protein
MNAMHIAGHGDENPSCPTGGVGGQALLGRKSVLMGMAATMGVAMATAAQSSPAFAAGTTKPVASTTPTYIPKWAPSTAYVRGQQVVSPNNDVVSTKAAHTSSAAYATDTSMWTISSTYVSVGVTNVDASSYADDLCAAIAALPEGGGRVWASKPTYTLTNGISTSKANLEIVGTGGSGQDFTVGEGGTVLHVPSGQVGFKFNPGAPSTIFRGPVLRRLHFHDSSGSGAALGGVHIYRTNNFILEDVTTSEFGASHPAFLSDGTGDCNAYGEMRNYRSSNNMIGAKHIVTNGLRYMGGFFQGQHAGDNVIPSSVAMQHSSGDTLRCFGTVFQNYTVLVDLIGGTGPSLLGCRFEVFGTHAIRVACLDASVRGGTINNYLNSSAGKGISLVNGAEYGVFDLDYIDAVATKFSDDRTSPTPDYRLSYPPETGYPSSGKIVWASVLPHNFGTDAAAAAIARVANGITLTGNQSASGTGTHVATVGGTSGAGRVMNFIKSGPGAQDPSICLYSGGNSGPLIGTEASFGTMVVDHSYAGASKLSLRVAGAEALAIGSGAKLGFFGHAPVVRPSNTAAAATDLATAMALVNDLRAKLLALGIVA